MTVGTVKRVFFLESLLWALPFHETLTFVKEFRFTRKAVGR